MRPPIEMTASGPFAMGPSAMSGPSSSKSALRSGNAITAPSGSNQLASELTNTGAPKLHTHKAKVKVEEEDAYQEIYSEPEEEGVEIVDMNQVKAMDWSAPDVLNRGTNRTKVKIEKKHEKLNGSEESHLVVKP